MATQVSAIWQTLTGRSGCTGTFGIEMGDFSKILDNPIAMEWNLSEKRIPGPLSNIRSTLTCWPQWKWQWSPPWPPRAGSADGQWGARRPGEPGGPGRPAQRCPGAGCLACVLCLFADWFLVPRVDTVLTLFILSIDWFSLFFLLCYLYSFWNQ